MFEYSGWIVLRLSPGELEDEDILFDAAYSKIQRAVNNFVHESGGCSVDLRPINVSYFFSIVGSTNHAEPVERNLLGLLHIIADSTPGSYGLIYIQDDENTEGFGNEFQVLRVVRGKVERLKDNYLSPCIPVIEDP
jgi:hypothetical protein